MTRVNDFTRQTDEQLLSNCRRGDEGAWEALVKRYQRLIYAVPRRAGLDEDAASEVFQDVFTTLLQNLDSIEQPSRLHAWLVTTARRKTWRVIQQSRNLRAFGDEDDDGRDEMFSIPDTAMLPDEALERLQQQHLVRVALANLDERCQKLVTMLFYRSEPPSYSEVASSLGVPEGSIGPTRARCLKKLTEILKRTNES